MGEKYYYLRYPGGKSKAVTLSYDDGVEQDEKLIALMERDGFKGTFNLNGGLFAPEGTVYEPGRIHRRLPLSRAAELYASPNVEVAVHSYTHPHLELLSATRVMEEIVQDRKKLEEVYGGVVRGMAYPYGTYNDQVVEILRMAGICYSRTVASTRSFELPTDWLRLPATCHHNDFRLMELAETFLKLEVTQSPKLFYLWGHAYEFEDRQNWDVVEGFFRVMKGNPEIWYATNMEIYDYVQAYERLAFSSAGDRVYNPSASEVWLSGKNGLLRIPAGATVDLA